MREVTELRRHTRPMPVRDPIAGDPGIPFKVVSYIEPASTGQRLAAHCVRTDGQADAIAERIVLMWQRVPVGATIFAVRAKPFIDDPAYPDRCYRFVPVSGTTSPMVVRVSQDGGAAGSDGTFASWTYSLFDVLDTGLTTALATEVQVQSRLIPVAYDQAPSGSFALAVATSDGEFTTWTILSGTIAESVASTVPCEEE